MESARTDDRPAFAAKFEARSDKAMGIARFVRATLIVTVMVAAWQDRALWPFLHDRMQVAYDVALETYGRTEGTREYVASLASAVTQGGEGEQNAIVETLLKLKN